MYAVDGATSELVWKFATDYAGHASDNTSPTQISSKPALGTGETLYVTTPLSYVNGRLIQNVTLYSLKGSTGELL